MDARARKGRHRRAFTLVELLVVVSVVLLLMGILLPALQQAREAAQNVRCMSNQRQVGIALFDYLVENDGPLPAYHGIDQIFPPEALICPQDRVPDVFPEGLYGMNSDLALSYVVNADYYSHRLSYDHIRQPSDFAYAFDGVQALSGGSSVAMGGQPSPYLASLAQPLANYGAVSVSADADASDSIMQWTDGHKVRITHVPPGNYAAAHAIWISVNGLNGHMHHGNDVIGEIPEGITSSAEYLQARFARRHFRNSSGNVLMLDGHVVTTPHLDSSMLLGADGNSGGGNSGGGNSGGGNSGGGNSGGGNSGGGNSGGGNSGGGNSGGGNSGGGNSGGGNSGGRS